MFWLHNFGGECVGHTAKPGGAAEGAAGKRRFKTGMNNHYVTYLQVLIVIGVFRKSQN